MMQRRILFLVLVFFTGSALGQKIQLKTYSEKIKSGFEVYADNDEYCPISVELTLTLTNMSSSEGEKNVFVIPPRSKRTLLTTLKAKERGKYRYSYKTNYNYGNHLKQQYDSSYNYYLPLPVDQKFLVSQGYNGKLTHQGKNAIDFKMPVGTPIYAIRGGVVVKVVEDNVQRCPDEICQRYNNKIIIYHEDGTFATYAHLMENGAIVNVGDTVKRGQLIGKSGNTGWTTGPHLHLEVYQQFLRERISIKTKFKIDKGQESIFLKEKSKYVRNYQ